jgi:CRISPR-associated endonuclease/helicase Cas3
MPEFYAHSLEGRPEADWEPMRRHEQKTAHLCRQFLRRIDPALEPWGDLLGRWHDLGKGPPRCEGMHHAVLRAQ